MDPEIFSGPTPKFSLSEKIQKMTTNSKRSYGAILLKQLVKFNYCNRLYFNIYSKTTIRSSIKKTVRL